MNNESVFLASGLVNNEQLDYAMRILRHRVAEEGLEIDDPNQFLAEILVDQEVLTKYQSDQLLSGRTKFELGQYVITDWIGQGGMGQVFKGVHKVMGRECAVKVLPSFRATSEAQQSFDREIRMQSRLDCPYLVRAFDAGRDSSTHYLVTEYVPGMDLRRLVKTEGALPVHDAARIIMQAALGLDYAHSKGLVHRDVKPGNILVTPDGDAKVSDVGLAGFTKDLMNDPRAGKIVGTTDYLSPEQIKTPLEVAPASDIYSLGCTLYYTVCGKVPFPGGDTESKLKRHLEAFPLHPRNFNNEITEEFVDIIVDMMEKDVSRRISCAAEVASRLEPWAESGGVGSVSVAKSPWMPPPPPSHEDAPGWGAHDTDGSNVTDGQHSSGAEKNSLSQDSGDSPSPPPAPPAESDVASVVAKPFVHPSMRPKQNAGMIVAITLAIAIPPALLAGAIIGYLIAQ